MRLAVRVIWIAIHAALLLAVVAVPAYAIGSALHSAVASAAPTEPREFGLSAWPRLLANTLIVTSCAAAIAVALGVAAGGLIGRTDFRLRGLLLALLSYMACLPPYVSAAFIFQVVPLWATPQSAWLCGLYYGLLYAPLASILIAAAVRNVDPALEDLARVDTGPFGVFRRVTLPLSTGSLILVGLIVAWLVATDFTIADLMQVRTFADAVYVQYQASRWPAAPLLTGAPLLVALFALVFFALRRSRASGALLIASSGGALRPFRLTAVPRCAAYLMLLIIIGVCAWLLGLLLRRIESAHYFLRSLISVADELGLSLATAISASLLITFAGVGLAHALIRTRTGRLIGPFLVSLLLALPAPVIGVSLIGMLNHPGWSGALLDSPAMIACGYVVRFLAVAVWLLSAVVARQPRELEWLVQMDGGDWLDVQRYAIWPSAWPTARAIVLVVCILCIGEVGCTVLLRPPGWEVVSAWIFVELHRGVYRDLAALTLATCIFVLLLWLPLIIARFRRRMTIGGANR